MVGKTCATNTSSEVTGIGAPNPLKCLEWHIGGEALINSIKVVVGGIW